MKNTIRFGFLSFVIGTIASCKDKPFVEPFNPHDHTNMVNIDTFPVNISTYKLDSFRTSDMKNIFTGINKDQNTGRLQAVSYIPITFRYSLPEFSDYDTAKVVYDSLMIYLRQNEDYCGDTNVLRTIYVYRVRQDIEPSKNDYLEDLYNRSSFRYDSVPLTTLNFYARPKTQKLLKAHLPDSLGRRWLQAIISQSYDYNDTSIFRSPEAFLEYFKALH